MADKPPKSALWVRHPTWTFALVTPASAALLAWSVVYCTGPAFAIPESTEQSNPATNPPGTPPATVNPAPPTSASATQNAPKPEAPAAPAIETERRLANLEQRQEALVDRVIEARSKTIDWWLAYLAVFTAVLALFGVLLPFVMGRREREQVKDDLAKIQGMRETIEQHLQSARKNDDEIRQRADELKSLRPSGAPGASAPLSEAQQQTVEEVRASSSGLSISDRLRAEALGTPETEAEKAYALWQALLALEPDDAQAAFYCGYYAQELSETGPEVDRTNWRRKCREHYLHATELKPNSDVTFFNWGAALDAEANALAAQDLPAARALWQQAGQRYAEALRIKPDKHEAANNWGSALDSEASALAAQDLPAARALWQQAGQRYADALRIKPDKHEAAYNWGSALDSEANALAAQDLPAARALWQQAGQRYADALRIKPDMHEAAYNWGIAFAAEARVLTEAMDLPAARALWQQAGRRYAEALRIKPDMYEAAYSCGIALAAEARTLTESMDLPAARALWQQAGQHYADTLRIKPDMHEAANNWGSILAAEARALAPQDLPAARALWKQAGQRYAEALRVKPDKYETTNNWGNALLQEAAAVADGAEAQRLHEQARTLLEGAAEARPDFAAYNLACAHARLNNFEASLTWLRRSWEAGGLPNRSHLEADPDLVELRQQAAFVEFLKETFSQ